MKDVEKTKRNRNGVLKWVRCAKFDVGSPYLTKDEVSFYGVDIMDKCFGASCATCAEHVKNCFGNEKVQKALKKDFCMEDKIRSALNYFCVFLKVREEKVSY